MVAFLVTLVGLIGVLSFKMWQYKRQIRNGGRNERYALLGEAGDESSDSENEIFMIDETRDLYSAPRQPLTDNLTDTDIEFDEYDDNAKKDDIGDLGMGSHSAADH